MAAKFKKRPIFRGGVVNRLRRVARIGQDYLLIRQSGRFDQSHYLGQITRRTIKHHWPLIHYLISGERKGLEPAVNFSPLLYLGHNEHLLNLDGSVFAHFLAKGGYNDTLTDKLQREIIDKAGTLLSKYSPKHQVAIVCHIFYFHLIDELMDALDRLDLNYDLVCTVTVKKGADEAISKIQARKPAAAVLPFPNIGRDIFPFTWLSANGVFAKHVAICKIHSKKSLHRSDGDNWRHELINAVIGNPTRVQNITDEVQSDRSVGLVSADDQIVEGDEYWGSNYERTAELCARLGIDVRAYPLRFASGSIFWLHPLVMRRLNALHLTIRDFERETGQLDGTTAHAVERVLGFIVQSLDLKMQKASRY